MFFFFVISMAQRKNFETPWGIETQTFGFWALMLYYWATETLWWARPLQTSYMTCVLHTARISNVDSIMFCTYNFLRYFYFFTELKTDHLSYSIYVWRLFASSSHYEERVHYHTVNTLIRPSGALFQKVGWEEGKKGLLKRGHLWGT